MKIRYSKGQIASDEVLKFLALSGMSHPVFSQLIKRKEMARKASELGIMVSDEQLQRFADSFRMARGLRSADEMLEFLKTWDLTEDEFERFCEISMLTELLETILADESKILETFANERADFDTARVSVILVDKLELANELAMQIREDGEDFHALARKHSVDSMTKYAGGHLGIVGRGRLDPEPSAKVFNASAGDVLGPFEADGGYQLILVEDIQRADLSRNEVRQAVKERILGQWIGQFLKDGVWIEPE